MESQDITSLDRSFFDMAITEVESFSISIPLPEPVSFSTRVIDRRDYAITRIRDDSGNEGIGYSIGYEAGGLIANAVEELLAPIVEGADPRDSGRLWQEMFEGTIQVGRKGLLLRAISTVDVALWDLNAKSVDLPLYKYLGACREELPTYAAGGYYRDDEGVDGLRKEMKRYVADGHDAVKMKIGRQSLEKEIQRVKAVRETIGPDRTLLMDANGAWDHVREAVEACRRLSEFDPYFIEEPVMPDSIDLMRRVREEITYGVAAGELEYTKYGFAELIRQDAVDVLQPDATVLGGITEWMKVAHTAGSHDIPIAPHGNWILHSHLLAAIENGLWAEYSYRDYNSVVFDDVLAEPLAPEDGVLSPPDRPGHGVVFDDSRLEEFRE